MKRYYLHQLQNQVHSLETKPQSSEQHKEQAKKNEALIVEAEHALEEERIRVRKRMAYRSDLITGV